MNSQSEYKLLLSHIRLGVLNTRTGHCGQTVRHLKYPGNRKKSSCSAKACQKVEVGLHSLAAALAPTTLKYKIWFKYSCGYGGICSHRIA